MLTTIEPPRTAVAASSLLLTDCRSDQQLYALWIARFRSPETIRAYQADWARFHAFCPLPLHDLRVDHLHAYLQHLENLQLRPDTVFRRMAAVKSLRSYGCRLGYLPINVGAVVKMPERVSNLWERILPAETVARILLVGPHRLLLQRVPRGCRWYFRVPKVPRGPSEKRSRRPSIRGGKKLPSSSASWLQPATPAARRLCRRFRLPLREGALLSG